MEHLKISTGAMGTGVCRAMGTQYFLGVTSFMAIDSCQVDSICPSLLTVGIDLVVYGLL